MVVLSNVAFKPETVAVFATNILISVLLTSLLPLERFAKAYYRIIVCLAILSWLSLPLWFFGVRSPIGDFVSMTDVPYQNFLVFGIRNEFMDGVGTFRNAGIFWEPGAFQVFLNVGFVFGILFGLVTMPTYFILLITILTANSTTGIVVFGILSIVYIIQQWKNGSFTSSSKAFICGLIICLGAFLFAAEYLLLGLDKFQEGSSSFLSFEARTADYLIDWHLLMDFPFQGIGLGNYHLREVYGIDLLGAGLYWFNSPPAADGLFVFLVQIGLLGCPLLAPFIFPRYLKEWSWPLKMLTVIAIILMFNNENMFLFLLPIVMAIYGLASAAGRKKYAAQ